MAKHESNAGRSMARGPHPDLKVGMVRGGHVEEVTPPGNCPKVSPIARFLGWSSVQAAEQRGKGK